MEALMIAAVLWAAVPQKQFDPHVYAYELFSEDEASLSRAQDKLSEAEILTRLEAAWVELDRIADAAAGLPEAQAKSMIRLQVRGDSGVSAAFARELDRAGRASPDPAGPASWPRRPLVWAIAAALALLILLRLKFSSSHGS